MLDYIKVFKSLNFSQIYSGFLQKNGFRKQGDNFKLISKTDVTKSLMLPGSLIIKY